MSTRRTWLLLAMILIMVVSLPAAPARTAYADSASVYLASTHARFSSSAHSLTIVSQVNTLLSPNAVSADCGFPVAVAAEADSWVDQNSPLSNFTLAGVLKVQSQADGNSRALMRFPLPAAPPGCILGSALLYVHVASAALDRNLGVLSLAGEWAEETVTWSNQPATTGLPSVIISDSDLRRWDVTAQVQAMYDTGINHGFLIRDMMENGSGFEQQLMSRENASDGPELLIRFVSAVLLDPTAPDTAIASAPVELTLETSASFSFLGSDDLTAPLDLAFECRLDGQAGNPFAFCASPTGYSQLGPGEHTFEVRAVDGEGKVDLTPALLTWTILPPGGGGGELVSSLVTCGQVLRVSTRVLNNLSECPQDGLVVGAPGIIIDLNGRVIDGVGLGIGIRNDGFDSVTVQNGTVREFDYGVRLSSASLNALTGLIVDSNQVSGIELSAAGTYGNQVRDNIVSNSADGIALLAGVQANIVFNNALENNSGIGLLLQDSSDNLLESNRIGIGSNAGMLLEGASKNILLGNRLESAGDGGILVTLESNHNRLRDNFVSGTSDAGFLIEDSHGNQLTGNTVTGTGDSGFALNNSSGNQLIGNIAHDNSDSGISLNGAHDSVVRNNDVRFNPSGIELGGSSRNLIESNEASLTASSGIDLGPGAWENWIRFNRAIGNSAQGISVEDDAPQGLGNLVEDNIASDNQGDGIYVAKGGSTLRNNVARNNRGWGIYASETDADGGGNIALGNAELAQCFNIICNAPVTPTPTPAPTDTLTPTRTPTDTPEPTTTAAPTETAMADETEAPTSTPEATGTAEEPTGTLIPSNTPEPTETPVPSPTITFTHTATSEPTPTPVPTTATNTPTATYTFTASPEPTATATDRPNDTPVSPTTTPIFTSTPEPTATNTITYTPVSPTTTPTFIATMKPIDTGTHTPTATQEPADTPTSAHTSTLAPEPTVTVTYTPVLPTVTPTFIATEEPTATSTSTDTPVPTTFTPTSTATPVPPSATNMLTQTPVPPSATRTASQTPVNATATHTLTATFTATLPPTATPTAAPTDTPVVSTATAALGLIFSDDFESGSLSAWSSSATDSGDLDVNTAAALVGAYGLQAIIDDNTALSTRSEHPAAETRYRARFYFDPNSIVMANGDAHVIFRAYSTSSTIVLRVEFGFSAGGYQIRTGLVNDGSTWKETPWIMLSDGAHLIELDWRAATGAGANDGGLTLWIDGVARAILIGVDNDTRRIEHVTLGALAAIDSGTRGTYYFDAFESYRMTGASQPPTNSPTPTAMPQPTHTHTPLPPTSTPSTNTQVSLTDTPASADTATPTATAIPTSTLPPDLIFADGFESGNLSAWSAATTDGGDLGVSPAAALVDTRGLQAVLDDNRSIFLTDNRPSAESAYRARFYFDPNTIRMSSGNSHNLLQGYTGSSTQVLRLQLGFSNGGYQLRAGLRSDGSTWTDTVWFSIADAPHSVELQWRASSGPGVNNGALGLWIDGVQVGGITGVDNNTRRIDRLRLGAVSGVDSGTRGTYYFDAFESRRETYIGP